MSWFEIISENSYFIKYISPAGLLNLWHLKTLPWNLCYNKDTENPHPKASPIFLEAIGEECPKDLVRISDNYGIPPFKSLTK